MKLDTQAMTVPVLMITYNRLAYTREALPALLACPGIQVHVIDNGSEKDTWEYLRQMQMWGAPMKLTTNPQNAGIAGAMNQFLKDTVGFPFCGKVDNDTIARGDWAREMIERCITHKIDIMQARHPLIAATAQGRSFDEWIQDMPQEPCDPTIRYHHFVGGSGIVFKRKMVMQIPTTDWKLYGWREFQRLHPELKKAFCTAVTVDLLDAHGYGDYPEYYKETRRTPA